MNQAFPYKPIKIIDMDNVDRTNTYKYSWSTDGVCWTDWVDYEQYGTITKNIEGDFYLRILLTGSLQFLYINGELANCYSICVAKTDFLDFACDNPNLFQPYQGLDCALQFQQQIADAIVCMIGIPVYYFRVSPEETSKDYTFKEFALHNVVACKQLKLLIPDGQMPSSNPQLQELDFSWQADWETELSKTQFATAFGDTVIPKQRDIVYIPLMKRMWQVNSAYDEKQDGFMWRSTTWKLALTKYQASTNIDQHDFQDIIDNFVGKTWENTFQENETNEQSRESGYDQVDAPKYAANNLFDIFLQDAVRQSYTKDDINILSEHVICHHSNVVARNIYQFKNENGMVTYQKGICGDSGMISFICITPKQLSKQFDRTILSAGPIQIETAFDGSRFVIGVEDMFSMLSPFSTYLVIYKWSKENYVRELSVYKHIHRTDMPSYLIKPISYWFDTDNPICKESKPYNLDYEIKTQQSCYVQGYPLQLTNIKLYNIYMNEQDSLIESLKYTTDNKHCIINDVARPINAGRGYSIR